jgi:serine/threonine protein kinase
VGVTKEYRPWTPQAACAPGPRSYDGFVNPERSRGPGQTPKACPSCGARFPVDALFCSLDGSPLTTSPSVIAAAAATDPYLGREILGHIEIRQLVGIGAMGRVYRAFQRGIDRDVAVKILHRELSTNAALVARFDREAKVASRLAHPNVVHVLLVGQLPDGAMYIVMEYLDGLSLQSALAASDGAMPLPRALHIALQLSDAAGEGHAQGIVHRDLKPENVMLVRRADDPDFVKVLDFGVARVHWGEASIATAAGLIFGTARYISPEGAQGETVGPQGDVYSIATILYQMLSGQPPFHADQAVALLIQQIHDPPPALERIPRASYVPEAIAAVVMRNLSKKPVERAENGRAFGRALLAAAVGSGLSAQDVLTRPSMLGGGQASAVQMPSMQRTKQLQLDPETAGRIGAVTAYETPATSIVEPDARTPMRTEIADPSAMPPGAATTRWSPPAGFGTKLLPPQSSAVDATLDDQQAPPSRTLPLVATIAPTPTRSSELETTPPTSRVSRSPVPSSKPPSSVDATLGGDSAAPESGIARPSFLRGALFAILFLLVGALGMTGVAWKTGLLGAGLPPSRSPDTAGPDRDAIQRDRQYAPQGAPSEESRAQALETPIPPLTRVETQAVRSGTRPSSNTHSMAPSNPPRAIVEASATAPGIGQPVDFSARVVPASNAPRVAKVDEAHFLIAGPGIAAGTELPASDDGGGVFRTTFTFLQGGRFDVAFSARADGSPVRSDRVVIVGEPSARSPVPGRDEPPPPASANGAANPGAKWL